MLWIPSSNIIQHTYRSTADTRFSGFSFICPFYIEDFICIYIYQEHENFSNKLHVFMVFFNIGAIDTHAGFTFIYIYIYIYIIYMYV